MKRNLFFLLNFNLCSIFYVANYNFIEANDKNYGKIIAPYFTSWARYKNKDILSELQKIGDKITHLIYGFASPDSTNNCCKFDDNFAAIGVKNFCVKTISGNLAVLMQFKKQFPNVKILLSIGGGTVRKDFLKILRANKLEDFVRSCVEILDSYSYNFNGVLNKKAQSCSQIYEYSGLFDGIDINWEWSALSLTTKNIAGYFQFIKLLKDKLLEKGKLLNKEYILTATLQSGEYVYKALPLKELAHYLDYFILMGYDIHGLFNKNVGFNSPVYNKQKPKFCLDFVLNELIKIGVPQAQLILALPAYGYLYNNSFELLSQFKKGNALPYYVILKKYCTNKNFISNWNADAKSPFLKNVKDKKILVYDNVESISHKVQLAKEKNIAGISLWALHYDNSENDLLNSIYAELNK